MPKEKIDLLVKVVVPLHVFKSIYGELRDGTLQDEITVDDEIDEDTIRTAPLQHASARYYLAVMVERQVVLSPC